MHSASSSVTCLSADFDKIAQRCQTYVGPTFLTEKGALMLIQLCKA